MPVKYIAMSWLVGKLKEHQSRSRGEKGRGLWYLVTDLSGYLICQKYWCVLSFYHLFSANSHSPNYFADYFLIQLHSAFGTSNFYFVFFKGYRQHILLWKTDCNRRMVIKRKLYKSPLWTTAPVYLFFIPKNWHVYRNLPFCSSLLAGTWKTAFWALICGCFQSVALSD